MAGLADWRRPHCSSAMPGRPVRTLRSTRRIQQVGGGFFLGGAPQSGYNLPGSVFDKEFRCTFDLLGRSPPEVIRRFRSRKSFSTSMTRAVRRPGAHRRSRWPDRATVPFRPELCDFFDLSRILLRPEALLEGRRIDEFFSTVLSTEFWLLWSTHHGVAAAAQRDRVPALHEPLPRTCSRTSTT